MNLMREVAAAIAKRGPSTLDDITPLFPEIPRKTVQKAMGNGKALGLLQSLPAPKAGTWGCPMATYIATPKSRERPPPPNGRRPQNNMIELEGLIDESGPCSIESLMPHTTMTRQQAQSAASNLVTEGRIEIDTLGQRCGRKEDRRPSTYRIVERQPERGGAFWQRKVSSVFDLAKQ